MIRHITTWADVLVPCQITGNRIPTHKEPSVKFIKEQIIARHKTLEVKRYEVIIDMPHWMYPHFRAHREPLTFTGTRREDLQNKPRDPNEIITAYLNVSAEDLIHIANQRLCFKSHGDTIMKMADIKAQVATIEPLLTNMMVRQCVADGVCRERKSCGFTNTNRYKTERNDYMTFVLSK